MTDVGKEEYALVFIGHKPPVLIKNTNKGYRHHNCCRHYQRFLKEIYRLLMLFFMLSSLYWKPILKRYYGNFLLLPSSCGFNKMADNAGLNVRALMAEIII